MDLHCQDLKAEQVDGSWENRSVSIMWVGLWPINKICLKHAVLQSLVQRIRLFLDAMFSSLIECSFVKLINIYVKLREHD